MRKLVEFNTDFELKSSDVRDLAAFEMAKYKHQRQVAVRLALKLGLGLRIMVYEDHKDIYLDELVPAGTLEIEYYHKFVDERDGWIL